MKKMLCGLLCLLLVVTAAGCGQKRQITVGFAQISAESEWRSAHTESIKEAAREAGINLVFADAQQSQEKQIEAVRSFIAKRVDVIALMPIVSSGWDEVLTEAKKAHIPVVIVDRSVDSSPDLYTASISSTSPKMGEEAFDFLASYFARTGKQPRDGGSVYHIAVLEGTLGASATQARKKGFESELAAKGAGKFDIVANVDAHFRRQIGREAMENLLRSSTVPIDAVFAHNDDMALGAIQAIEAAGLRPGQDIILVSVDGIRGIFEAMAAGKANCTIECDPLEGPILMETVKKIVAGEPVDKEIYLDSKVYTADTAAEELPNRKY